MIVMTSITTHTTTSKVIMNHTMLMIITIKMKMSIQSL